MTKITDERITELFRRLFRKWLLPRVNKLQKTLDEIKENLER